MIISPTHKYIFIKCKKVAGSTTQKLLETHLVDKKSDMVCNSHRDALSKNEPVAVRNCYNHATANEIIEITGKHVFDAYTKIVNIRHPGERFISEYYWQARKSDFAFKNFSEWIRSKRVPVTNNWPVMCTYDGTRNNPSNVKICADVLVCFEDLRHDIGKMFKVLQSEPPDMIPHLLGDTRKDHTPWQQFISDDDKKYIRKTYPIEIEVHHRLGYQF